MGRSERQDDRMKLPSDGLSEFEIQEIHRSCNILYRGMPKVQKRAKKEAAVKVALAARRKEQQKHDVETSTDRQKKFVQESPLLDFLEKVVQEMPLPGEHVANTTDFSTEIKSATGVRVVAEQTMSGTREDGSSGLRYHRLRIPYPIGASTASAGIEMPDEHA